MSDRVIDNDGLVEYDSAMGFRLGTTINDFFANTRNDCVVNGQLLPGSWYRRYRSDVEQFNHDVQREEVGRFVRNDLLVRDPGPLPGSQGDLSVYP